MTARVNVRYFASLRETLGEGEAVALTLPCTVGELRDQIASRGAPHAQALGRDRLVRCALNHTLCAESVALADGAEVAFFPPITGG